MPHVYILKSVGQPVQMYIGFTGDLDQRINYHNSGRSPHTSKFMPCEIVYSEQFDTDADALKRERQIRGWTRAKKEALIVRDVEGLKRLAKRDEKDEETLPFLAGFVAQIFPGMSSSAAEKLTRCTHIFGALAD